MAIKALPIEHEQHDPFPQPTETLEDVFSRFILTLASLPVHSATQEDSGILRPDGLDARALRGLALRWCMTPDVQHLFGEELAGLEMALQHFCDLEFEAYVRGLVTLTPVVLI